jgi:hypothetical protein
MIEKKFVSSDWRFFIYSLHNDAVSSSDKIVSTIKRSANKELQSAWEENLVAQFKLLPKYLPARTEKSLENPVAKTGLRP